MYLRLSVYVYHISDIYYSLKGPEAADKECQTIQNLQIHHCTTNILASDPTACDVPVFISSNVLV